MVRFHNNNKVYNFFHIPKTAGTSISNAIKENFEYEFIWKNYKTNYPIGAQHLGYDLYKHYVHIDDINFAVVRNPVDRISSLYNNFITKDTTRYSSFTEWFSVIMNRYPHILESQKNIISDGNIKLFDYNNLHRLETFIGVQLPKLNVLAKISSLTNNEIAFIKNYYKEDYQLMEYKVL